MQYLELNRWSGRLVSRWTCSYQGQTDVNVNGATYCVRQLARHWDEGDFAERQQQVGCIWSAYGACHDFPPPLVCALFPELVPAMYSLDLHRWVYKGGPPKTVALENGDVVMASLLAGKEG